MRKLISNLIPRFIKNLRIKYLDLKYQNSIKNKDAVEVFQKIYETNHWGDPESISGGGSNTIQTAVIAKEIPILLHELQVKKLLDLPCGDFNWMRNVDLNTIKYIGGDIVPALIEKNDKQYHKEGVDFEVINLLKDELPGVDLIFCRDCFIHLKNADVQTALDNILRSDIRYLLTTSFLERTTNTDILTGQWRPLNLTIAPFNLKPIKIINEQCTELDGQCSDKSLILVDLNDIRKNA